MDRVQKPEPTQRVTVIALPGCLAQLRRHPGEDRWPLHNRHGPQFGARYHRMLGEFAGNHHGRAWKILDEYVGHQVDPSADPGVFAGDLS